MEQRLIRKLPYGSVVEMDGREVYVPRLIAVRSGRIVRTDGSGPDWIARKFVPAKGTRRAEWILEHRTEPYRETWARAELVFCRAEDNPGEA